MPEYKKRNVKKVKAKKPVKRKAAAPATKKAVDFDIPMEDSRVTRQKKQRGQTRRTEKPEATRKTKTPKQPVQSRRPASPRKGYRIIRGGKNQKKSYAMAICVAVLVLAVILVEVLTPTGMIETIQNKYSLLSASGSGTESLQGERFLRLQSTSDSIAVLSDVFYELYNTKGGTVLYDQHGFSNPQMVRSSARTIVYESGGKGMKVYNNSTRLFEKTFENNIYTATVCRNGSIAAVTQAVGYAAHVEVLNKNLKTVFTKNFAEDLVNCVALSDNGKYLAVAVLSVSGGDFESKIYGYRVKTGAQLFEVTYKGVAITSLNTVKKNRFIAMAQNQVTMLRFDTGAEQKFEINQLEFFDTDTKGNAVLVHAYQGNTTKHNVTLLNSKAKVIGEFEIDGAIKDIGIGKERVFFLLDTQVHTYSFAGERISVMDCGFNTTQLAGVKQNAVMITGKQLVIHNS